MLCRIDVAPYNIQFSAYSKGRYLYFSADASAQRLALAVNSSDWIAKLYDKPSVISTHMVPIFSLFLARSIALIYQVTKVYQGDPALG